MKLFRSINGIVIAYALVSIIAIFSGCGNSLKTCAVQGTITLDGKPLKNGSVTFVPCEHNVPGGGAPITNGAFAMKSQRGLQEGEYIVQVSSMVEDPNKMIETMAGKQPEVRDIIPPQYGDNSTTKIVIYKKSKNIITLDVKSK